MRFLSVSVAANTVPFMSDDRRSGVGEPQFSDPEQAARWRTARRAAIDHVLAVIVGSWWSDDLVLRGSYLLQAWAGDRAREPVDLDWVFLHDHTEEEYGARYADLLSELERRPTAAGGVVLDVDTAYLDETEGYWDYEGWGMRLEIPWRVPGLPPGRVRVDFAAEKLPQDRLEMTCLDAHAVGVLTPSRELSLAWKLLWQKVEADEHSARGKDLYYPWVEGSAQGWQDRLFRALTSLLAAVAVVNHDIAIGDSVTVTAGPFSGYPATVSEVSPTANKVKALAQIFQRETPLELSYEQVRKN
jgi:hypothetical protein